MSSYLVMGTFNPKQIVLQVTPSLSQLQQGLIREDGPVNVGHDCTRQVGSGFLQHIQDEGGGLGVSAWVDDEGSTCGGRGR